MSPSIAGAPLLQLVEITKAFPGVVANDHVSLDLRRGEIHTILGENGAGKTTLMGIVAGLHRPDSGSMLVDGEEVVFGNARDALARGIGSVQQHFALIPTLTIAENVVLALRSGGTRLTVTEAGSRVLELCQRYGIAVDVDTPVEGLSVVQQQRGELLKALIRSPRILVLDEPTALLTPQEAAELASILRQLAEDGVGIFFISHKLEEVVRLSDRVTVLRRGRRVDTLNHGEATQSRLAMLMVGRLTANPVARHTQQKKKATPPRLEATAVTVAFDRGGVAVRDATLRVSRGEILGIAGLEGSGQVELTEALAGVRPLTRGEIHVDSKRLDGAPVVSWRAGGVAHIPADRLRTGLVPELTVAENLALPVLSDAACSWRGVLRRRAIDQMARNLMSYFDIRAALPTVAAGTLSGGNQQRMLLARELAKNPGVIICCYPTRGLDFASTEWVQNEVRTRRDQGAAVVYASVDLDELLAIADRIAVLHAGEFVGEVTAADATSEQLGLMLGGSSGAE